MRQKEHQVLEVVYLDYVFHSCGRPGRFLASAEASYQVKYETGQVMLGNQR